MRVALIVGMWSAFAAGTLAAQTKEVIQTPDAPPGLPFSSAVRVGNLLFLSGQIGVRPGTVELVPGGIEAETRQTMENIRAVLEYAGGSLEDLVKCTVFLVDLRDYGAMNVVYASFLPERPPARSTTGATGLALGARVEIECIAVARSR